MDWDDVKFFFKHTIMYSIMIFLLIGVATYSKIFWGFQ